MNHAQASAVVNEEVRSRFEFLFSHFRRQGLTRTAAQERAATNACMNRAERRKHFGERSHRPPPTLAPSIKQRRKA